MSDTTAPATTTPAEPAKRGPLVLERPVKNTLAGSSLVQAKRSPQVHVLPSGATKTLCAIDTAKWSERVDVEGDKTNCPLCGAAIKSAAKEAKEAAGVADSDGDVS